MVGGVLSRRRFLAGSGAVVAGFAAGGSFGPAGASQAAARAGRLRGGSAALATVTSHAARHPLDPLDADEIMTVFRIVEHSPHYGPEVFFPIVKLVEPSKDELAAWHPGAPIPRRAFANVYDHGRNLLSEALIDLRAGAIERWTDRPDAQPAVYLSEWSQSIETVMRDPRWRATMTRRGIDPDDVYVDIWAPGELPSPLAATGDRFMRLCAHAGRDRTAVLRRRLRSAPAGTVRATSAVGDALPAPGAVRGR